LKDVSPGYLARCEAPSHFGTDAKEGSDSCPRISFEDLAFIELKRPSHRLDDDDVRHIRSYASATTNNKRFDQENSHWEFWLIDNEVKDTVDEVRHQTNLPPGIGQSSKKYTITVRTWAEIIGDAHHRLKFVQQSLQYECDRDQGLVSMRD